MSSCARRWPRERPHVSRSHFTISSTISSSEPHILLKNSSSLRKARLFPLSLHCNSIRLGTALSFAHLCAAVAQGFLTSASLACQFRSFFLVWVLCVAGCLATSPTSYYLSVASLTRKCEDQRGLQILASTSGGRAAKSSLVENRRTEGMSEAQGANL